MFFDAGKPFAIDADIPQRMRKQPAIGVHTAPVGFKKQAGHAEIIHRFLLLGRLGIQSSKTSDLFVGTGAATALRNPTPSKNLVSYKYGVGAEYDFTKNVGVRGEFERYRVSDGISGKVNVNALTASVLYRF